MVKFKKNILNFLCAGLLMSSAVPAMAAQKKEPKKEEACSVLWLMFCSYATVACASRAAVDWVHGFEEGRGGSKCSAVIFGFLSLACLKASCREFEILLEKLSTFCKFCKRKMNSSSKQKGEAQVS